MKRLNCIITIIIVIIMYYSHPLPLLHSSLIGSQNSMGLIVQELLVHCSAKNFLTLRHVLRITACCIGIYRAGRRLSSFKVICVG
jgi:hypothetical protein